MALRVAIDTEPEGWILHRAARELADRLPDVAVNPPAGSPRDLTYHVPAWRRPAEDASKLVAGLFTHGVERARKAAGGRRWDALVCMNRSMWAAVNIRGYPSPCVIQLGVDPPARPPIFGVVGRVYGDGRKGEDLVALAVAAGYDVRACGPGWPCPTAHPTERRAEFYAAVDYVLVTSRDEGGPMCVPEAIAHGKPVIAPDVGWCWHFPVIRYGDQMQSYETFCKSEQSGGEASWASLEPVLFKLANPPTWADWAEGHRRLFAELEQGAA